VLRVEMRSFFFQAEDGIRDLTVTGVQTCALPILMQPRGVFIICSGRVKLTTSSTEGKTLIVKIAEEGEVLGASATILGKTYEVSAETIEPSQVNFIKRDDFLKFLNTSPEACMHTAQQLS